MFSSGDGGVGAGTCGTNDGTNRTIFQPVSANPDFCRIRKSIFDRFSLRRARLLPAYVADANNLPTSEPSQQVGATFHIAPERGTTFSQGGFSVYFPRPSWQEESIPPFLEKLGDTYKGLFK